MHESKLKKLEHKHTLELSEQQENYDKKIASITKELEQQGKKKNNKDI